MKTHLITTTAALVLGALSTTFASETYVIDPVHSTVGFKIRHFFSDVPGRFTEFEGTIEVDFENPEKSSTTAKIKTASIDTANEKRDEHLRAADFFDAEKFPDIVFKTTGVEKTGEETGKIKGELTMHGVTKPIELAAKLLGKGKGMEGEMKTGWKGTTTINRKDFGLDWGKVVEGTAVLGDEVEIELNIEANKK